MTWHISANVARQKPRINVKPTAGPVADDDSERFALVEFFNRLRPGLQSNQQGGGNKRRDPAYPHRRAPR